MMHSKCLVSLSVGSYLVASAWKMWSSAILIYIELRNFQLNNTKFDTILLYKAEKVKKKEKKKELVISNTT